MTNTHNDDAPLLTDALARSARRLKNVPDLAAIIRRGRPKLATPKQPVSIRLDEDVLAYFKATGKGWQTRINETLKRAAGL